MTTFTLTNYADHVDNSQTTTATTHGMLSKAQTTLNFGDGRDVAYGDGGDD